MADPSGRENSAGLEEGALPIRMLHDRVLVSTDNEPGERRSSGGILIPATVAIHGGRLLVGLDAASLEALATAPAGSVRKAARPTLAVALAEGGWAATTVSATMIAARAAGITAFATGGIGGVHRGALGVPGSATRPSLDVSSDLEELGRTDVEIEVDGGIHPGNAGEATALGTTVLVAGSAVFGAPDRREAIAAIRSAAEAGKPAARSSG